MPDLKSDLYDFLPQRGAEDAEEYRCFNNKLFSASSASLRLEIASFVEVLEFEAARVAQHRGDSPRPAPAGRSNSPASRRSRCGAGTRLRAFVSTPSAMVWMPSAWRHGDNGLQRSRRRQAVGAVAHERLVDLQHVNVGKSVFDSRLRLEIEAGAGKSSMEICTPSFSRPVRIAATAAGSCTMMLSVNSMSSRPGSSPVSSRIPRMRLSRPGCRNCRADRLTATRSGRPASVQARAWAQAWRSTPLADRQDEAGLLGERDELFRRNHAVHRMLPADERLDAGDRAARQTHLRLVVRHNCCVRAPGAGRSPAPGARRRGRSCPRSNTGSRRRARARDTWRCRRSSAAFPRPRRRTDRD